MAYDARRHDLFMRRVNNLAQSMDAIRREAAKLDTMFLSESASGSDPAYVDHELGDAIEATDMITVMRAYEAFLSNAAVAVADRQDNLSAFTANQQP